MNNRLRRVIRRHLPLEKPGLLPLVRPRPLSSRQAPAAAAARTMDTAAGPEKLALFEAAMQKVYGPYDAATATATTTATTSASPACWEPPASPGAGGHRGRYLWTDAFGVVNFVTLARARRAPSYLALAERLADAVHEVLGRERDGGERLPGATDAAPLAGGLRIGKMDDSGPDADGQYHHYLTLWMFALDRLARATGNARWAALAAQIACGALPRFFVPAAGREGEGGSDGDSETMVWKVSTDLRRVLVPSKGHLDDLDGFVVCRLLRDTLLRLDPDSSSSSAAAAAAVDIGPLDAQIARYRRVMGRGPPRAPSGDPLDLGMGLWVAHFDRGAPWARRLAASGLRIARARFLTAAARPRTRGRLAFREFGACLGIKCYCGGGEDESLGAGVEDVLRVWEGKLMRGEGEEDGDEDEDLRPINLVMYAAALIPGAFRDGYVEFSEPTT